MTAVATGIRGPRTQRWLMPLLVGSLALNLIVIGAAGSFLWRGHVDPLGQPLGRRVVPSVVGYAVTLPPERVRELERLTKEEWEKVRPLRRALLDARDASNKALTAEPFDRERFLGVQARLEAADRISREAAFKLQSAIAVNLTPEERRGYLRWRDHQRLPQNPLDVPEKQAGEPQR
ncbi:MAG TPA: periplasmic heavy metal sensor [Hyphomicrobiaceae bacterium]|jgi:hypothetical protein|nr:periplasmic heavy metal sensor [Hyphomicrobiaceae bacterium]